MTKRYNGVIHVWFSNTGQDLRRNFSQFCEIFLYMPRNMVEQICQQKKKKIQGTANVNRDYRKRNETLCTPKGESKLLFY